jgi:hypothetical protein
MVLLGKIESVFYSTRLGVVVTPELSECPEPNPKPRVGDKIQFRRADGFVVKAAIKKIIPAKSLLPGKRVNVAISLVGTRHEYQDLNEGMDVWLLRDE